MGVGWIGESEEFTVIRCSHCGKLAPDGAKSCQQCGMPLANMSGGLPNAGPVEQKEELPAWLESLRAHERPVASGLGNNQPFTMDELVDENRMPRWMSQEHPRMSDSGSSDSLPAVGTSAQPEQDAGKPAFPASGLAAGSLIDEQSLPAWMRGTGTEQPVAGQSFSAHNLVDQQALPAWIKELGQGGQPATNEPQYGLPAQPPVTPPSTTNVPRTPAPARNEPSAPLSYGFSAHDLVDQKTLPTWMSGDAQGAGTPPQTRPVPTGSGFSAGELIDGQSVPTWMQEQPGQAKAGSTSAMGVPVNGSGQMAGMSQGTISGEGMPASTLLDTNSMPTWMREGEQGTSQPGSGMSAGSLIDKDGLPAWMREDEQSGKPQAGAGMAAGSLIDKGGLPAWMREQSGAGQPQSANAPRNEGMRVPSRPRSDTGMLAQSDEAANIFSSMLGVAASAPVIPGQAPIDNNNPGVAQMPTIQYPQQQQTPNPVIPGWQTPPQTPPQAAQPQPWQMANPAPASPTPTAYAQGSQANSLSGMQAQTSMSGQVSYPGQMASNMPGNGSALGVASGPSSASQATDTKKKGFFDSIRDFFFK